jgi:hypothetical protein
MTRTITLAALLLLTGCAAPDFIRCWNPQTQGCQR